MQKLIPWLLLLVGLPAFASLPIKFDSWTPEQKAEFLWKERILPSRYQNLPAVTGMRCGNILRSVKALATLNLSFDVPFDEIPEGRIKFVHAFGAVAKVKFEADPTSPYTGMYQGAEGLARLSLANPPTKDQFTPGMALKFFIRGEPSVNLHVMHSVDGQGGDKNFFARIFTNRLPLATGAVTKVFGKWFSFFATPFERSVDHLSYRNPNGKLVEQPVLPYQLYFVPTPQAQGNSQSTLDFREELAEIPAGTVLYEVWARAEGVAGGMSKPIGRLVTASEFVASQYGDEQLLFQHRR